MTEKIQGYQCPACGCKILRDGIMARNGRLPAVRYKECAKCHKKYWNKNESIAYQNAKANLKTKRKKK